MASWNFLAAIFAVILLATWWGYRMLRTRGDNIPLDAASTPRERSALLVGTRFLATAWALMAAAGTVTIVAQTLTAQAVAITIPVSLFWPGMFPGTTVFEGPTATVEGGGFSNAEVMAVGLDQSTRLLLAGGQTLQGITSIVIALAVAVLCHRMLDGRPFRPILARSVIVAAVTIIVCSIGWQYLFQAAGEAASTQILHVPNWTNETVSYEQAEALTGPNPTPPGLPLPSGGIHFDFTPVFIGLALLVIAVAFRRSERMQRDTDGLV